MATERRLPVVVEVVQPASELAALTSCGPSPTVAWAMRAPSVELQNRMFWFIVL